MDNQKLILHDYNDLIELTTDELKELISEITDIEEVTAALAELYERDITLSMGLGKNILLNNLGDEFLQAAVIDFIFEHDKQYVLKFTKERIETLNYYLFGCVLDCFSDESSQPFGQNLSISFLQSIVNKYNEYSENEKIKIRKKFEYFLNSYAEKIQKMG